MKKGIYIPQIGRSMAELLTVLAVMGILSLAVFHGYDYAISKLKANKILNDSRIVHLFTLSAQDVLDWTDIPNFIAESQKKFTYLIDDDGIPLIRVEDVEQKVCQQLLTFKEKIAFYTEEFEPLSDCQEQNNIVLEFEEETTDISVNESENSEEPDIPSCETGDDCEGENSYCQDGTCKECTGEGKQVNEDKTACICSETTLTCSDEEGNEWCCGPNEDNQPTICGVGPGECIVSNGLCNYTLETNRCDCSYTLETNRCDCSYTLETNRCDCQYDLSTSGILTPVTPCTGDKYCYLSYKNNTCTTTAGANTTGPLYGTCVPKTSNAAGYLLPDILCSGGKYCYISYTNEGCTTGISAGSKGKLYGTCVSSGANTSGYLVADVPCPGDQYCYISHTNEECTSAVGSSSKGKLYGNCVSKTSNAAGYLIPQTPCPAQQYCYFKWSEVTDSSCTGSLGAGKKGALYGACVLQSNTNPSQTTCPVTSA